MFYNRCNDLPCTFTRAPEPTSRYDSLPALEVPVLVHGKMGGRYKQPVEGVLVALSREYFLVRVDHAKWAHLDTYPVHVHNQEVDADGYIWHHLYDVAGIREGYLFRKNIVKLFKVLAFLVREFKKKRKSREKLDAIEAARGHRVGKCPVCFKDFIADGGGMVLHGYRRPGGGSLVGDCYGVNFPCLEVSAEGAQRYLHNVLRPGLEAAQAKHALVSTVTTLTETHPYQPARLYTSGEPGFEAAKKRALGRIDQEIRYLQTDITTFEHVVATWYPKKWPRKDVPETGDQA